MAKEKKSLFFCTSCGYESRGWMGKCPACGEWNSFAEAPSEPKPKTRTAGTQRGWLHDQLEDHKQESQLLDLEEIQADRVRRFSSGIDEIDRVLGGGFVQGGLLLVGGEPGIGKSTLLLQIMEHSAFTGPLLYVCGEESPAQVKIRAQRLGVQRKELKLLPETSFERIAQVLLQHRPPLVVIDSIQTIYSEEIAAAPGSVTQVRDCAAGLLRIAKDLNLCVVLVGHVTKEGGIAGPRILEHMVDTVLYFDGDTERNLRILRSVKNRFGSTDEIGIFRMERQGLVTVTNPSETLLEGRPLGTAGTVITATVEGSRPLLLEIQALVVPSSFSVPQRMTQGADRNRFSLLMAVADKWLNTAFSTHDAYLNLVGGLKSSDPGIDLALIAALVSSYRNRPLPSDSIVLGEVGLSGELRQVNGTELRLKEAGRLGFRRAILPNGMKKITIPEMDLIQVDNLSQALDVLFSQNKESKQQK